jgi:hypothetical protein
MAKFKCNHSGNVFEFLQEHDIKTMRVHTEYTEVLEETPVKTTTTKKVKQDETSIGRNDTNHSD